jgi:hypothetical protein
MHGILHRIVQSKFAENVPEHTSSTTVEYWYKIQKIVQYLRIYTGRSLRVFEEQIFINLFRDRSDVTLWPVQDRVEGQFFEQSNHLSDSVRGSKYFD